MGATGLTTLFSGEPSLLFDLIRAETTTQTPSPTTLRQTITTLSREVCAEWLLRLAQGQKANLSLHFQRYLQYGRVAETVAQGKRTVAELERLAEAERKQGRQQSAAADSLQEFAPHRAWGRLA
jgi:hypothetical protein